MQQHLSFQICGDYITELARSLWIEGEYKKALSILRCVSKLTEEQSLQITTGKKKLTGINELTFVDDDITEMHGIKLKSVSEALIASKEELRSKEEDLRDTLSLTSSNYIKKASPWGLIRVPFHVVKSCFDGTYELKISWEEFEERFPSLVQEAREKRETEDFKLALKNRAYVNKFYEEKFEVRIGTYKDRNGWLLPDGKFYICDYGKHLDLLRALKRKEAEVETTWLKVQHPNDMLLGSREHGFHLYPLLRLTKKQKEFIWDYCDHHKLQYPKSEIEDYFEKRK